MLITSSNGSGIGFSKILVISDIKSYQLSGFASRSRAASLKLFSMTFSTLLSTYHLVGSTCERNFLTGFKDMLESNPFFSLDPRGCLSCEAPRLVSILSSRSSFCMKEYAGSRY